MMKFDLKRWLLNNHILKLGIRKKIIYSMLILFAAIFLCYIVLFLGTLSSSEREYNHEILQGTSERIETELNHYFDQVESAANTVRYNRSVQKLLRNGSFLTQREYYELLDYVSEYFNNISDITQGNRLYLINEKGEILNTGSDNDFILEIDPIADNWNEKFQHTPYLMEEVEFRYAHMSFTEWGICLYYPVYDYNSFQKLIGYLAVCIPNSNLDFLLDGEKDNSEIQLLGQHGQIIIATKSTESLQGYEQVDLQHVTVSGNSLIYSSSITDFGWNIYIKADQYNFLHGMQEHYFGCFCS